MNLFYSLFYEKYVSPIFYPLPIKYWVFFNEALATFPIIDTPLPGFTQSSRRTKKIQLIVLHHTGSLEFANALKWFGNPNTYSSVHYLIDLDGYTQQLVPEENASLHVPNTVYKHSRLVNEMSIGISLVGNSFDKFTEAQYEATAMLCAFLLKKYSLTEQDIFKHSTLETINSVTPANDPSPWDEDKFKEMLEQFGNI